MNNNKVKFLITCIRIFLGYIFFSAGFSKLTQISIELIGPEWLEERLSVYGLGLYARFIAWSQLIVGLFLLSRRFALLGAIMLFPMILNIWIVTISLQWPGTPHINLALLILNLILLVYDYHKLKFILFQSDVALPSVKLKISKLDFLWMSGFLLLICSAVIFTQMNIVGLFALFAGLIVTAVCFFLQRDGHT